MRRGGVWRPDPPKKDCGCFEDLKAMDTTWNNRLFDSVRAEGLKPANHDIAWADLPTRGQFALLREYASREVQLRIPPISDWLMPEETTAFIPAAPSNKERGGKRGR